MKCLNLKFKFFYKVIVLRMSLNVATRSYLESSHFQFGRSVKHSKGDTLKSLKKSLYVLKCDVAWSYSFRVASVSQNFKTTKAIHYKLEYFIIL